MTLYDEIQKLKNFECEDRCVLTVYLNTNPADLNAQNGAWRIHLKNGLKRIEEYLEASNDENEIKNYKSLKKKVEREINDNQDDLQKGVVIFASPHKDLWSVHYVQVPVKTNFHWETKPELDQLRYMYKAYPYAGIILPSFKGIRILDTSMGIINEEIFYEFDPGLDFWVEQKGVHSATHTAGSSTGAFGPGSHVGGNSGSAADDFQFRMKENLERFYKDMGSKIEKLKKDRHWDEIHIVGEAEHAKSFSKVLQKKPESCIFKNLINSAPGNILHEVFEK
ncbi:VLRF1 family aeRF1-type release factor [Planococcus sp. CAU13]|uniref:VLRF1 family aeRF1-type release factor n=1 Tax=Planococcus sp. CAU13 TaxID=1541197 RepID=UPI00052FF607|nr:VLRF1 family aeRF1-type release factor [Planococcus sp. CAU13]